MCRVGVGSNVFGVSGTVLSLVHGRDPPLVHQVGVRPPAPAGGGVGE